MKPVGLDDPRTGRRPWAVVQLRPENVEAWLTPQGRTLDALDALLDDKARPYYEHRLAA